jgi:hypothetical protein
LTYANVALTLALVFAMSGGAYAAKRYLITSTKQISPSVLKSLKGANGKEGANGANGAQGPQGPQGNPGAAGGPGPQGVQGEKGATGAAGAKGAAGAMGPPGPTGPQGPLQKGVSEGGEWSISTFAKGQELRVTAISFNIPLEKALAGAAVHFIQPGETLPTGCSGTAAAPVATSGNLCVFAVNMGTNMETGVGFGLPPLQGFEESPGADKIGTQIALITKEEGEANASGTWAVTG